LTQSRKKLTPQETFPGLPDRIKKLRDSKYQEDFGETIGVSKQMVSKYEAGLAIPSAETLRKIADYGGVTVEFLLRGENKNAPQVLYQTPEEYDAQPLRPLETDLLMQIIAALEQLLAGDRRLKLTPAQKARLIALLYEHCRENREKPTLRLVKKYLLLAD
jgi:transcriptional regulator with XRE-family HTH domain